MLKFNHFKQRVNKYKRKIWILAGYNGNAYNGSQKQNQILTTVENEIETALYKCGMIRESNYRSLSKISFSRATRTDKGVHALLNWFSAKLLIDLDKPLTEYVNEINQQLSENIRIFTMLRTTQWFNAK